MTEKEAKKLIDEQTSRIRVAGVRTDWSMINRVIIEPVISLLKESDEWFNEHQFREKLR